MDEEDTKKRQHEIQEGQRNQQTTTGPGPAPGPEPGPGAKPRPGYQLLSGVLQSSTIDRLTSTDLQTMEQIRTAGPEPGPSSVSWKSNWRMSRSMDTIATFRTMEQIRTAGPEPGPSAMSWKSNWRMSRSMDTISTFRVDHGGPGLTKYLITIHLDSNSINTNLRLSDNNRTVTCVDKEQPYPHHQDRFETWLQVLCSTGLTGRCFWEAEWNGDVCIAVSYRGIRRKGFSKSCMFGGNNQSWSLSCFGDCYSIRHNNKRTVTSCPCPPSGRVGVCVDCPAGRLSFYEVSSDSLRHIHTVLRTSFTEPLYPGFMFYSFGSSVSLCRGGLGRESGLGVIDRPIHRFSSCTLM